MMPWVTLYAETDKFILSNLCFLIFLLTNGYQETNAQLKRGGIKQGVIIV